jgi:hypothetical protein
MSRTLVDLGCCIDSHSHRDLHDAVLRDLAVLTRGADQFAKDASRVRHPPAAVDEIPIRLRSCFDSRIDIETQQLGPAAGGCAVAHEKAGHVAQCTARHR